MGMIGHVIRISEQELNTFLNDSQSLESKVYSNDNSNAEWYLDLDKSWDGINYLLTGEIVGGLQNDPNELQRALFSFQIIDEQQDLGYGPAHYLNPTQVKETCSKLEEITDETLNNRFDGSEMNEMGIYTEIWTEPESFEFLVESFRDLKEFYRKAVKNGQAIVSFIS